MTMAERIFDRVQRLPESTQRGVLDFVEYLAQREGVAEGELWSAFSLASATAGLEDDEWPVYDPADFKERW